MTKQAREKEDRVAAAINAIEVMGGAVVAARKINELTGKNITRDRIQKWKLNGIAPPWHPIVHQLTKIPLNQLDAEIYPLFLGL
jgi:hypothetical protein